MMDLSIVRFLCSVYFSNFGLLTDYQAIAIIKHKNLKDPSQTVKNWLLTKKIQLETSKMVKGNKLIAISEFVSYLISIEDDSLLTVFQQYFKSVEITEDDEFLNEITINLLDINNTRKLLRKRQQKIKFVRQCIIGIYENKKEILFQILITLLIKSVTPPNTKHAYVEIFNKFKKKMSKDIKHNILPSVYLELPKQQAYLLIKFLVEIVKQIEQENISPELHQFILASLLIITINQKS